MRLNGAVSPSKAETLMGRAFRERFDKQTFHALCKASEGVWVRNEPMVRSELIPDHASGLCLRRFSVSLARNTTTGEKIIVNYQMPDGEMAVMHEENFNNLGETLAERANAEIERAFMALD